MTHQLAGLSSLKSLTFQRQETTNQSRIRHDNIHMTEPIPIK